MAQAHYLSMIVIGVGSFIFGVLPIGFSLRASRSYPLFLSLILCLGAGILLATSLIHMLTEVQVKLKLTAQLYFCGGFLILYTFDEITHYCLGSQRPEIHSDSAEEVTRSTTHTEKGAYGAAHNDISESSPLLPSSDHMTNSDNNVASLKQCCDRTQLKFRYDEEGNIRISQQDLLGISSGSSTYQQGQVQCHVEVGEPCPSNPAAKTGLLIALLIHSILEGVSIGVQTKVSQILLILGAITFHKVVLSFCLGLELLTVGYKTLSLLLAIFLFAVGSPIGIAVGMFFSSSLNGFFDIDAQLQAVAAGSLLYVAAFEVLPRERFKWHHKSNYKAAGIFQLIFVILGFMCITVLHLFVAPEHDIIENVTESVPQNVTEVLGN